MNKKTKKTLVLILAFVLVAGVAVAGTLAYLQDRKEVKNTFTVGNVKIALDEAVVDELGQATDVRTEVGNKDIIEGTDGEKYGYKLFPGVEYAKDPTTSILENSEDCYVRMKVTVNKGAELVALMFNHDDQGNITTLRLDPRDFFKGISADWEMQFDADTFKNFDGTDITLEFWYKEMVPAATTAANLEEFETKEGGEYNGYRLPALFTGCLIPGELSNEELATLDGMEITVVAEAIQAAGFDDAEAAFAALDEALGG